MSYNLLLHSFEEKNAITRDLGTTFFPNLKQPYKVYLIYYPGDTNEELETALEKLGKETGENMYVYLGSLSDDHFGSVSKWFDVKDVPFIVMTATADLASLDNAEESIYIKITNKTLLDSTDATIALLRESFVLFNRGNISAAIKNAKRTEWLTILKGVLDTTLKGLSKIWDFVRERDIVISAFGAKLELKKSK